MSDKRLTHDFDPTLPEDIGTAHALHKEMRAKCPVAHSETFGGFWALFKYDDVVGVLKNPKTYITSVQNVVPKVATTGRRPPLHLDPPEHTPYRRVLDPFFTEQKMQELAPYLRRTIIDLLEPFIAKGGGDFCEEFTHKLPGYVFSEFFNLSREQGMQIREVTRHYVNALNRNIPDLMQKYSLELYAIAQDIIDSRKREPMDPAEDVTSAYLAATYQGEPLPDGMILGTIRQLIVVGMIAPVVFMGSVAVHLSQHQDLQDQLRQKPELIPAAIEEYLRLFTPYRGFARTANRDVEIGGRLIKKDEPIALVYASANRDEDVFENPDEFILNRPNIKKHVAFGMGPHRCPGEPLARLMLETALEELLSRTKKFEHHGNIEMARWPEWGVLSVQIKVEPA